jgi:hypothetical protein
MKYASNSTTSNVLGVRTIGLISSQIISKLDWFVSGRVNLLLDLVDDGDGTC